MEWTVFLIPWLPFAFYALARALIVLLNPDPVDLARDADRLELECAQMTNYWDKDEMLTWDRQMLDYLAVSRNGWYAAVNGHGPGDPTWAQAVADALLQQDAKRRLLEQYEERRRREREQRLPAHEEHLAWLARIEESARLPQVEDWPCYMVPTFSGTTFTVSSQPPPSYEPIPGDRPTLPASGG